MSIKKNLLKNGFASSLSKIVRVLEQLFLVPFFIKAWGPEYYGEWLTLTIIPSVLAFSNLGFGTAAANTFVLRYAQGKKQEAANMVKSGFIVISAIIVAVMLLSIFALFVMNKHNVFEKSIIPGKEAIIAVALMMAARLLSFHQQLYEGFFRAAQKAARGLQLGNLNSLLNIILGFLVLVLGGNIIQYALVIFLLSLVFNPIYGLIAYKTLQLKGIRSAKILKKDVNEAFQKGIGYMMNPAWQALFFQGTTFIVRIVLGPESVAVFNTVRTLSRSINQLYSIINASILPELQYLIGTGDKDKARQLFRISVFITLVAALGGMIFLFFFGLWFYQIWTHKALDPPSMMWYIFVLSIGFNALWWTSSVVFQAVNKPFRFAFSGVIAALISVGITYILSCFYGLTGAAFGSLIMDLLLAFYILPISCKLLSQDLMTFISDGLKDFKFYLKKIKNKLF